MLILLISGLLSLNHIMKHYRLPGQASTTYSLFSFIYRKQQYSKVQLRKIEYKHYIMMEILSIVKNRK